MPTWVLINFLHIRASKIASRLDLTVFLGFDLPNFEFEPWLNGIL